MTLLAPHNNGELTPVAEERVVEVAAVPKAFCEPAFPPEVAAAFNTLEEAAREREIPGLQQMVAGLRALFLATQDPLPETPAVAELPAEVAAPAPEKTTVAIEEAPAIPAIVFESAPTSLAAKPSLPALVVPVVELAVPLLPEAPLPLPGRRIDELILDHFTTKVALRDFVLAPPIGLPEADLSLESTVAHVEQWVRMSYQQGEAIVPTVRECGWLIDECVRAFAADDVESHFATDGHLWRVGAQVVCRYCAEERAGELSWDTLRQRLYWAMEKELACRRALVLRQHGRLSQRLRLHPEDRQELARQGLAWALQHAELQGDDQETGVTAKHIFSLLADNVCQSLFHFRAGGSLTFHEYVVRGFNMRLKRYREQGNPDIDNAIVGMDFPLAAASQPVVVDGIERGEYQITLPPRVRPYWWWIKQIRQSQQFLGALTIEQVRNIGFWIVHDVQLQELAIDQEEAEIERRFRAEILAQDGEWEPIALKHSPHGR